MSNITFITGNQSKADYLAKYLNHPVSHHKLDLDELQSLDLKPIVEHKVRQAYAILGSPVIVEDVSLEFAGLGRLPGPFIKWFIEDLGLEKICRLVDGQSRAATAKCVFGYYDGVTLELFEGSLSGRVSDHPAGAGGFGFDSILIPDGFDVTRAELNEAEDHATYSTLKPFEKLRLFLENR
jgi:non-canonical purine NTP pyrophosphatase (RdgB/HAM1 family)